MAKKEKEEKPVEKAEEKPVADKNVIADHSIVK